jgi:hypothetical protein
MNPYTQIMGWWFTNGTALQEVKPFITRLMHRYDVHGFVGQHHVNQASVASSTASYFVSYPLSSLISDCFVAS